jgi:chromosome segregation ATPase
MSGAGSGIAGNTGSSSFAALELLADPAKLQSKIDSLKAAEDAAREQITLAGPASEILQIREEIDGLKELAEDNYNGAKADAEALMSKAREDAAQIISKAHTEAAEAVEDANKVVEQAEAISSGAKTEHNAAVREREVVEARKSEQDHRDETLQQKADALDAREQELEGEKAKLTEARELIQKALG